MNPIFLVLIVFYLFGAISSKEEEYAPIIQLKNGGKIRGISRELDGLMENDPKRKINIYQGFRFARAKRFGKPEMVTSWPEDVYNATKDGNTCPQFSNLTILDPSKELTIDEDCLFLNIHKPVIESKEGLLPVMVWYYGGGFQSGSIYFSIYDPSYLATIGDVIVVSINYRLGPLGFLYDGTENAPGNQGLYDQLMGLKWIKENIENFGGDPNRITIFGESAGSMSVSSLIISPLAKGLFDRAIMQSGAIRSKMLAKNKFDALEQTKQLANKLGCDNVQIDKIVECLRKKSLKELIDSVNVNGLDVVENKMFEPIIDDEFLPKNLDQFNQVDLMFGVNLNEGSLFASLVVPELEDDNAKFTMEKVLKIINEFLDNYNVTNRHDIINYYTKNLNVSDLNQVRKTLSDLIGDSFITCPTYLLGEEIFQKSKSNSSRNLYAYRFDRRNDPMAKLVGCNEWMGVCHALEVVFEFINPMIAKMFFTQEDNKLAMNLIKAWTEFARTGQPGSFGSTEWLRAFDFNKTKPNQSAQVLSLNFQSKMIGEPFKEACDIIWRKIIQD